MTPPTTRRLVRPGSVLLACAAAALLGPAAGAQTTVLHIGSSPSISSLTGKSREQGALQTLRDFIKSETGMDNEIARQKTWQELADKMANKKLDIGVFQGYEFAWAQEKHPGLEPLALAVNVHTYPAVYVVARRDDPATNFAGLQGHSLAIPEGSGGFVRLFVDRQSQANGKPASHFFSQVTTPDNAEDALDDLVDGKLQAVAADRAALEAYKRRKPGRFAQLKEVAHSQPFPPAIIAYQQGALDEATLRRFRDGLVRANQSDRGQTLLTLFKLTGFEAVPPDLGRVLAEARKAYPPQSDAGE